MRRFEPDDLKIINEWLASYGKAPKTAYPPIGFIEPGIAVGFLWQTDCPGFALTEGLVTNPKASPEDRDRALTGIRDALIGEARQLGITKLIIYTSDAGILHRALESGAILQDAQFRLLYEV